MHKSLGSIARADERERPIYTQTGKERNKENERPSFVLFSISSKKTKYLKARTINRMKKVVHFIPVKDGSVIKGKKS